jgi:ABC-2 type transport system permease protein
MRTHLKPQSLPIQLVDLTLVQLSNWRWSWLSMLITSTLAPMLSTVALGVFASQSGPRTLGYILTGNLVLSLMFGTLDRVASNFSFMRQRGMLSYFASLPIHAASLVLATILAFFLLALPSVLVTLVFGAWFLGLSLHANPLVVIVLPLAATSLAGLGALIGNLARSPEEATSLSLFISLLLVGLGPVIIPPERLPSFLLALGWFSPATYAASALRQALLGPLTARLGLDLFVLAGISLFIFWLVGRKMEWRGSLA